MPRLLRRPDVLKRKFESTSFISTSTSTTQRACLRRANLHFDNLRRRKSPLTEPDIGAAVANTACNWPPRQLAESWTIFSEIASQRNFRGVASATTPMFLTKIWNCKRLMQPLRRRKSRNSQRSSARKKDSL